MVAHPYLNKSPDQNDTKQQKLSFGIMQKRSIDEVKSVGKENKNGETGIIINKRKPRQATQSRKISQVYGQKKLMFGK